MHNKMRNNTTKDEELKKNSFQRKKIVKVRATL